ncbi:MAG: hypothetical protein J6X44_13430, partial [Thermoguttaceae bacterium]|nr:hypothetical protein [Thermoguttaceae bacterium]
VGLTVVFLTGTISLAQDRSNANAASSGKRPSYLAIERASRSRFPDAYKNLKRERDYTKRLPIYWGELGLSDAQTKKVYSIQKDYFEEIVALEARIARLERERYARMRAVLTDKQLESLDKKIDDAEKARKAKSKSSRDARL